MSNQIAKGLISFVTAGDPNLTKTKEWIELLCEYSDFVEVGIPFSDPVAEGEVIEAANMRALDAGVTTDKVFCMLNKLSIPPGNPCKVIILTYINSVFSYGFERFAAKCRECKVFGLVIPDLPYEEREELKVHTDRYGIRLIPLVSPVSYSRITKLCKDADPEGFVYLVSSLGTTGVREDLNTADMVKNIKAIKAVTDAPVYVGFGVSTPEQAVRIREQSDGVIVGSAIVRLIEKYGDNAGDKIKKLVKSLSKNII